MQLSKSTLVCKSSHGERIYFIHQTPQNVHERRFGAIKTYLFTARTFALYGISFKEYTCNICVSKLKVNRGRSRETKDMTNVVKLNAKTQVQLQRLDRGAIA